MAVSSETGNPDPFTSSGVTEIGSPFDRTIRGRLLTATATVIVHGGHRKATVDRILREANVGWADFSSEFEDLDACLLAALDAGFECAAEQAELALAVTEPAASPSASFDLAVTAVLDAIASNRDLAHLCLVESVALGGRAVEHKEAGLQRFIQIVQGLGMDPDRAVLPPLAAEMVVGGVYEVLQRKVRDGRFEELPSLVAEFRQLWLPVLRSNSGQDPDA
jgi:AcrR family transcriptional regulator